VPEVLIAGPDLRLASQLALKLPGTPVHPAYAPSTVFEHLPSADLLVIDDGFVAQTVEFLAELREAEPHLVVIYCLGPGADARLVRRLLLDLGVSELLFHPVNPERLARRIASFLGVPHSAVPEQSAPAESALARRLNEVWQRARARMLARVEVLERAGASWLDGGLDAGLRQQARGEAHALAGSLGTFGLPAGTRFARELERALESDSRGSESQALRFAQVAAALRLEVERSTALRKDALAPAAEDRDLRPALLLTSDADLAARLLEEAAARRWAWQTVSDISAAREAIAEFAPAAVLIDVDAEPAGTLAFLSELGAAAPPATAIILTSSGSLMDRVEVARRGGRGFFLKSLPAGELVQAAQTILERRNASAHVLAVDDDPAVLDALGALLVSHGIRLTAIDDPLALWEKLEGSPPDLLLLDIDMPRVTGIELCRVVRNDPRWAAIPVVFLTAHTDADTMRRVFAAGADDFVAKPIVGPELITRIHNRLERTRLLRSLTEVDALTGLSNRAKCRQAYVDFLRLADRHGQPMGTALLGIDGLEHVNAEYGSGIGDELLRQLGRCLREGFRSEELAGRWGGNEFAVGLYGLDRPASLRRLQDLAGEFAQCSIAAQLPSGAPALRVTLSGGVAGYPEDGSDLDSLLMAAGEARRQASAAGGNRLLAAVSAEAGPRLVDLAVVSDDEATATLLVHGIESEGYSTRLLRSGLTAARALCGPEGSLQARVLLIDAGSPGLEGLGLVEKLASEGVLRETAVLLLSSPSVGHEAARALELGAADFIAKPVDLPVLIDRVRQELERPARAASRTQLL
jgi:diguanylate cyclase (GGDEF)-like protein